MCLALALSGVAADFKGEGELQLHSDPYFAASTASVRGTFPASPTAGPICVLVVNETLWPTSVLYSDGAGTYYGDNGWEGEPFAVCLPCCAYRAGKKPFGQYCPHVAQADW